MSEVVIHGNSGMFDVACVVVVWLQTGPDCDCTS